MMGPYGHQLADSVFMRSPLAEVQVPKAHQKQKERAGTQVLPTPQVVELVVRHMMLTAPESS